MRRTVLVIAMVSLVALSGCTGLLGDEGSEIESNETVAVGDSAPDATNVNQTLQIEVGESLAGSELTAIGATYPRGKFVVDGAKHGAVGLGVDTDGDGTVDREFDESHVSGVNNNEYSFDVTLDTGYTLQQGDVVMLRYPSVDNPSEPGEYEIDIRLNDQQTTTGTVVIE